MNRPLYCYSAAIEWECENEEYHYVWGSANEYYPLPRIGKSVVFSAENKTWNLLVKDVRHYYDNGNLSVYIKCKVIDA